MEHGCGNVAAAFVVADQATPPGHPAEGSLYLPAAWQNIEASLPCRLARTSITKSR
jgi:hypothetical protein